MLFLQVFHQKISLLKLMNRIYTSSVNSL